MEDLLFSYSQLAKILDFLSAGGVVVGPDRKILAMNESALLMTGRTETEVAGKDCREVLADFFCGGECLFQKAVAENAEAAVGALDTPNGDSGLPRLIKIVSPIYDSDRNPLGCIEVIQDHSVFEELLERVRYEGRRMKAILDNIDLGVLTVDRSGYITFFNDAAETITEYRREEVLGKSCAPLFGGREFEESLPLRRVIGDGKTRSRREGDLRTKGGRTIPIRANYMALKTGGGHIVGGIATLTDLSLVYQFNSEIKERYTFFDMVGKAPAMKKIFDILPVIAESDATVLVEGETGTGKDILARVVHNASSRRDKPLVKVNCAALPENLLESEMFGYVKGAFTGADQNKTGRFQEADGGTIFLDEIGDLPLALQAKLLTVLEDKEFYPLGSRKTTRVDVRIISATNLGLETLVREKKFREDLFYRLNVMRIELPALKDRREDLPLLISHILKRLCAKKGIRMERISEDAMDVLLNHDYPGNIRELENILEHALIICRGDLIELRHLPLSLQSRRGGSPAPPPEAPPPVAEPAASSEARRILDALKEAGGNKNKAADALGVNRTTLWRKMKKLGIQQ